MTNATDPVPAGKVMLNVNTAVSVGTFVLGLLGLLWAVAKWSADMDYLKKSQDTTAAIVVQHTKDIGEVKESLARLKERAGIKE